MESHINRYGGLNKDNAYDSIEPTLYIDAVDIRITTANGESIGAFTNMKGNEESFTFTNSGMFGGTSWAVTGTAEIIGYTTIRSRIIYFVADDSNTKGWIYEVQYNPFSREILSGFPKLIYYHPNLNFSKNYPIEALGRFEKDSIQRVYWTDYNEDLRSLNLESINLLTIQPGELDTYPSVTYTQPLLKEIPSGGVLKSGIYQVCYRVRTVDGKETLLSPPGNLIHITPISESIGQSAQYVGGQPSEATGKAIKVIINTTDYIGAFNEMDVFLLSHENPVGVPTIQYIETQEITGTSLEFTITGNEDGAYDIELLTFTNKNYAFRTCKSLTQKDSRLVIANLKGKNASAADIIESFGESFNFKLLRYDSGGIPCTDEFNQDYNLDAHWLQTWHNNKQFKYQSDGLTLGAEALNPIATSGSNIKVKFHLEPFVIDTDNQPSFANINLNPGYTPNLNDGYTYYNTTFSSNSSPFTSGVIRGYKRGETYRFGLIFYNSKGEASFVEHIGDIKFPDISDEDIANNLSGTNYFPLSKNTSGNTTTGYSLGLEFLFDFSSCPNFMQDITSYQIVRVKREIADTRRLMTGIIKCFRDVRIGGVDGGFNFDNPTGDSTQHWHLDGDYVQFPTYPKEAPISTFNNMDTIGYYGDGGSAIKSDYLMYHTPELSFSRVATMTKAGTAKTSILNTAKVCLLATGAYQRGIEAYQSPKDLTGDNLAVSNKDYGLKIRTVRNLVARSPQHIKILNAPANRYFLDMFPNADRASNYQSQLAGPFPSSGEPIYLRNYHVSYDFDTGINNPLAGGGNNNNYEVSKGASGLATKVNRFNIDPISGASIPYTSSTDWWDHNYVYPQGGVNLQDYFPIIDTVLPKEEIYGGFTQSALAANIFIPASPVIKKSYLNPKIFGGDTFLSMFTFQSSTVELYTEFFKMKSGGTNAKYFGTSTSRTVVLPVECSFNIQLQYGSNSQTLVKFTEGASQEVVLRQEGGNSYTLSGKTYNMYDGNGVYQRENEDLPFFVKPTNSTGGDVNDIRGRISDIKYNGELVDSWSKFAANNFYDVDDYGPINKILNWQDTVFFFQDRAVGIYAINRAAITTSQDGVPTQLGTGTGFGKHQYYTKEHGSIHQWAIKPTEGGIYYFDAINRKAFVIGGGKSGVANNAISEIKGVHSWFQKLPAAIFYRKVDGGDNPILRKGVSITKDKINDEVIFTFLSKGFYIRFLPNYTYYPGDIVSNGTIYRIITTEFTSFEDPDAAYFQILGNSDSIVINDYSLVYDELMQQFSTFHSATPPIWIENGDILLSTSSNKNSGVTKMWAHNIGDYGKFYGVTKECSVSLVVNPNADYNKVLRTIEYNSIVRDDNKVIDRTQTITAFRIQTQYQDTGKTAFSPTRFKRKFDKWRLKIPRDQTGAVNQGRLRSTYFIVTLYFDNSYNKELIMNRLISYYDAQIF